jgi:hypothetical protein
VYETRHPPLPSPDFQIQHLGGEIEFNRTSYLILQKDTGRALISSLLSLDLEAIARLGNLEGSVGTARESLGNGEARRGNGKLKSIAVDFKTEC